MHASLKVRVMSHKRHTFEADLWRNCDDSATDTFQGLPVLSMSRPPTTQEVKVDAAILFSSGHRSVRSRCGGGRNALAIQVVLVLHLKISFSTHVSPMKPMALVTYDARGPVMPGGKEGQAGSAARRAREETRPVSALQRETVNVGGEKTSNPQCRPRSELVGLGMTGRLAARLAVAGNCETCESEATAHQPLLAQHWT
ncbi:hypothetical protein CFIO01_04489 [Colletotrichum fioriniae PJ7]|uniref:Uncharacterized protein n=1 Tax=Colletotrichum fioriniae PJ7 TaxID=1445577 RepID=A0A010RJU0_9PEZI|nr:hypothetical protein CFIO01_04489 [Colletotrichum fioriniae PJ7]